MGLPDPAALAFHIACHSLAAHLIDAGYGARATEEVLRHSSVQVAERYLGRLDRGLLDEAYRDAFKGIQTGGESCAEGTVRSAGGAMSVPGVDSYVRANKSGEGPSGAVHE
ncbi:MAG TPA: hypothetical protein VGB53_16510 [Rubricoccaceae bacterium]|jgi:hypothetical protein